MKRWKREVAASLGIMMAATGMIPVTVAAEDYEDGFTQRYQADDFESCTGNIFIRSNEEELPVDSPVVGESVVLTDADGEKYLDFSNPIQKYASNDLYGEDYKLVDKENGQPVESIKADTATWRVDVPYSGVYKLSFRYNNPATRVKGYRNDRDERNCRIMINTPVSEGDTEAFYTDTNQWAGWMIFNISGYNDLYDASANTSMTPQTDNDYQNVIGNTAWNTNNMNVYLEAGENTITLGIEAPPGQGVYDGPNLDYFDLTYIGDQYVSEDEIPYIDSDFEFQHPGIYLTMDDLETIKANKDDMNTVYGQGYQEMKQSDYAQSSYVPSPQSLMDVGPYNNPNHGGTEYTNDGCAAYYNALMWYLDGDVANAQKTIEILNGWASTLDTVADGNDLKLRFSIVGPDYLNAAEIIKHIYNNSADIPEDAKWKQEDMERFDNFIWKLLGKTAEYYPQANGNWDALIGGFNMAAAVYLEDVDLFNDALTQRYLGNIQGGNTSSMGALPNYVYPTGESQESSRDATHARMGISGLAYQAEIAWNQGIDLYGAYDNRLLEGAKYNASYLIGNDVDSETFISDKGRLNSDISSMVFEIVSNHYLNQVDEGQDVSLLTEAAEQRLRSGGTKNEAKTSAMYYGAMVFQEKQMDVELDVTTDKNVFTKAGDSIIISPNVISESLNKNVHLYVSDEWMPYTEVNKNEDGTYSITLTVEPEEEMEGDITVSSVKNASVVTSVILSYQKSVTPPDQGNTDNPEPTEKPDQGNTDNPEPTEKPDQGNTDNPGTTEKPAGTEKPAQSDKNATSGNQTVKSPNKKTQLSKGKKRTSGVKTGDSSNIIVMICTAGISLLLVLAIIIRKIRNK